MMDLASTDYLRFALALTLVLGLIALFAWLAKRFRLGTFQSVRNNSARLQVVESLAVDARQRLLIIRRDDKEHLLLVGPDTGQVIEAGFAKVAGFSSPIEAKAEKTGDGR